MFRELSSNSTTKVLFRHPLRLSRNLIDLILLCALRSNSSTYLSQSEKARAADIKDQSFASVRPVAEASFRKRKNYTIFQATNFFAEMNIPIVLRF